MLGENYQDLVRSVEVMLAELRLSIPDRPLWADIMDGEDEMRDPTFDPFSLNEYGPKDCVTSYLDEVRSLLGKLWCELDEDDITCFGEEHPSHGSSSVHRADKVEPIQLGAVGPMKSPLSPTEIIMAPIRWEGRSKAGKECKIHRHTRTLITDLAHRKAGEEERKEKEERERQSMVQKTLACCKKVSKAVPSRSVLSVARLSLAGRTRGMSKTAPPVSGTPR